MKKIKYFILPVMAILGTVTISSCAKKNPNSPETKTTTTPKTSEVVPVTSTTTPKTSEVIPTTTTPIIPSTSEVIPVITKYTFNTINSDPTKGTIVDYNNQEFDENSLITLSAIPNTGYIFIGWYNGDTPVDTSPTYQFNIKSDLTLTAKWDSCCYLTTVSDNNNGYVTPYTNEACNVDSSVTLEASGYAGYLFDGWYNGETLVSDSSTYTFKINSNLTLTAKWKTNPNIAYKQEHYTFEDENKEYLTGIIDSNVTEIVIPDKTEGILDYAFDFDDGNITSVTFPNTLKYAFCEGLAKSKEIDFYFDGDWFDFNEISRGNTSSMPYAKNGGNIYFLDNNGTHLHNGKKYSLQIDIILPEEINMLMSGLFAGFNHVKSLYMPASVTEFNGGWQFFNTSFEKIYYGGTQEAWNNINLNIEDSNKALKEMTIYFYSENKPATDGNYWHYVDGVITIWE